ncbi:PDR/VanB family oxidoreductase [Mycolicibacterium confluentis]|uniref:Ferredoxin n=1 Tax=Mycolicibacterium confluentis TaxID=28047 RepID=A0A7I7Y1X8_9MYCO|nr:PDR/VanB family oxidoreductase [Mycolicibacterium confluentis]MCV7320608.1 oxidoreductase [Mycolicibacterium confluentis]ORV30259.1 ferredoxin [Mycolicibacterium confluentis]BBZ35650.1 ferredoxin [Mycolicibacterium confluentis]
MTASMSTIRVRVINKTDIADDVVEVGFEAVDGCELPPWSPGAHIDLHLPNGCVRQYSLCADVDERNRWRVAVLLDREGRGGSRYIHEELAVGAQLVVSQPRNNFPLKPADGYVFVAGGIGITPLLPMIRHAEASGSRWRLTYGGRTLTRMPYLEELRRFGARVDLWPQDERGVIDLDAVFAGCSAGEAVYTCGPEAMLNAIEGRDCLASVHMERFRAATAPDAGGDSFEVELAVTGKRLTVPAGRSLLDVLRDETPDLPSSCEEGICGACEVSVLDGVPDHRDSVLDADERESNKLMMPCVSRSRCPLLVLDL